MAPVGTLRARTWTAGRSPTGNVWLTPSPPQRLSVRVIHLFVVIFWRRVIRWMSLARRGTPSRDGGL